MGEQANKAISYSLRIFLPPFSVVVSIFLFLSGDIFPAVFWFLPQKKTMFSVYLCYLPENQGTGTCWTRLTP